jgi:hypothetical protein
VKDQHLFESEGAVGETEAWRDEVDRDALVPLAAGKGSAADRQVDEVPLFHPVPEPVDHSCLHVLEHAH